MTQHLLFPGVLFAFACIQVQGCFPRDLDYSTHLVLLNTKPQLPMLCYTLTDRTMAVSSSWK